VARLDEDMAVLEESILARLVDVVDATESVVTEQEVGRGVGVPCMLVAVCEYVIVSVIVSVCECGLV
jgi:hypothetical protein